jgi:hypothetical protein
MWFMLVSYRFIAEAANRQDIQNAKVKISGKGTRIFSYFSQKIHLRMMVLVESD